MQQNAAHTCHFFFFFFCSCIIVFCLYRAFFLIVVHRRRTCLCVNLPESVSVGTYFVFQLPADRTLGKPPWPIYRLRIREIYFQGKQLIISCISNSRYCIGLCTFAHCSNVKPYDVVLVVALFLISHTHEKDACCAHQNLGFWHEYNISCVFFFCNSFLKQLQRRAGS